MDFEPRLESLAPRLGLVDVRPSDEIAPVGISI